MVQHVIQIRKLNNEIRQYDYKIIVRAKKIIVGILPHVFMRIVGI